MTLVPELYGRVISICLMMLLFPSGLALARAPDFSTKADHLHLIIPGGAGGGWDRTARAVGGALVSANLLKSASYENMSGGGSGKAIGYMIKTADRQHATLLVNSVPILVRSVTGIFPFSYRDLTPVASVIGDYGAIAVLPESTFRTIEDVMAAFNKDPRSVLIGGGSVRGDLDHIVAAITIRTMRGDPRQLVYVPYDTGGKALVGLLTGETQVLSTGLGEALDQMRAGQLRILAITASERVPELPDVPVLAEYGPGGEFANWRGFFGPPGLPAKLADQYEDLLRTMLKTPEWEQIRVRNGWANFFKPQREFVEFLEEQEHKIKDLREELGFQ